MTLLIALASTFGLFVVSLFILHVISSTYLLRSEPARFPLGDPTEFEWHIIVPALNEAAVLDGTLARLSETTNAHVWVIDDASDDATPKIAASWGANNSRIHVVTRTAPNARTGKGAVLNTAYLAITDLRSTQDPEIVVSSMRTIVGVIDADGVLDLKTFAVLSGTHCFADASVGAVQQDVWMRNADDAHPLEGASRWRNYLGATLLRLQDLEFRASIAAIQLTRNHTSSVAMGGNGQWTRLAALDDIVVLDASRWDSKRKDRTNVQPGPWHGALLEDFELGLHLLMTGWVTRFTPGCYVAQEALPSLSRYLRQRTRWCQGSMQCMRYLPDLWRSSFVGPWALLELCYYLLQPWLWILATFLFPLPLFDAGRAFVRSPGDWASWVRHGGGWMWLVMFWGTAVLPLASWAFTYRAVRAHTEGVLVTRRRSLHDGFAYVFLVNLSYLIAWRSFGRLLLRRNGWAKTSRVAERVAEPLTTSSQRQL
jgi:1,2-diacylglycerol 3-beta-glucosyltransferase